MPERKVTRETVLEAAAFSLVREHGGGRTERAGDRGSRGLFGAAYIQPVRRHESLVKALYDHARVWVAAYNREHEHRAPNAFAANGHFPICAWRAPKATCSGSCT